MEKNGTGSRDVQATANPLLVPKSAAPQGSRGRARRGKRATSSASSQRRTISPAVCGVSHGRTLELRASLNGTTSRHTLHDSHMIQQPRLSASLPSGGFLRSARLQPLGVVDVPMIRAGECLGIISATNGREMCRRPRSSTEPRVTLHSTAQQKTPAEKDTVTMEAQVKSRRTLSAVASYELNSGHFLCRSVDLPKNTALVPASAGEDVVPAHRDTTKQLEIPSQEQAHLPLVQTVQGVEGEMRIQVPSVRNSVQSSTHPETSTARSEIEEPTKLPNISPSNSPSHPKPNKVSNTLINSDGNRESGKHVSVISLGEVPSQGRQRGLRTHKKRWSPGSKGGKLSLGWSPTQPLGPIAGHSVHPERPDTGKGSQQEKCGGTSSGRTADLQTAGEAAVSKDYIHIEVCEYLENTQCI